MTSQHIARGRDRGVLRTRGDSAEAVGGDRTHRSSARRHHNGGAPPAGVARLSAG
ncbi:hypothetical protein [Streptomyces smyrnaeus]|uniref:hypothetical protein n=1 Tax=Streptomyces smyrnaeus TaxID=1387713 RepID=UPI0033FA7D8F